MVRLVKWTSPLETRAFVELVMQVARLLDCQEVEALMEPTGTYGDPLRALRTNRRRARQAYELCVAPEPDDPHESFQRRQAIALVDSFLAGLDERIAQVFVLAEIEQLSAPEIAAALGVKLNTVYSRLRLGRVHFEKWLARLEEDEP